MMVLRFFFALAVFVPYYAGRLTIYLFNFEDRVKTPELDWFLGLFALVIASVVFFICLAFACRMDC